jgi:hypothetical protein
MDILTTVDPTGEVEEVMCLIYPTVTKKAKMTVLSLMGTVIQVLMFI